VIAASLSHDLAMILAGMSGGMVAMYLIWRASIRENRRFREQTHRFHGSHRKV
jgi:hypothetical protein